jgi:hypothetical protein
VDHLAYPHPPATDDTDVSQDACPRMYSASVGADFLSRSPLCPEGALDLGRTKDARGKQIADLRAKVRAIERHVARFECHSVMPAGPPWTLGIEGVEGQVGCPINRIGLDPSGIHEVKPVAMPGASAAASRARALGFALRLAVRRCNGLSQASSLPQTANSPPQTVVCCWTPATGGDVGHLYGRGLAALGLDPTCILLVEPARASDVLWALEEALKSGAAAVVVGMLDGVDLTPARRLSLAAQATGTPCIVVTHATRPVMAATHARWRIGLAASRPDPLDAQAPGGFTACVSLERCRASPSLPRSTPYVLEWCDETYRFRVPAPVAHRTPEARQPLLRPRLR